MLRIIIVFVCVFCLCCLEAQRVYEKHSCVWEAFEASCRGSQVLLIDKAYFGRLHSSRKCFNLTAGEPQCFADVKTFVERHCGGRRDCKIKLTNENLKLFPTNCTMYSQKSLEIEYSCVDVYTAQDQSCVANQSLVVRTQSGYLANIVTDETGLGSQSCPWKFTPQPGQTVHLTLLDFGVWMDRADRDRRNICKIYATIKDFDATHRSRETLVCGGLHQEKFVMSTDIEITIAMMRQESRANDTAYFFLKYQVFDCPSYETPAHASTERSGGGIRISCLVNRDLFWDIKCTEGQWLPKPNIICPELTTLASIPTVSPCPEISPPEGGSVSRSGSGYMVSCSDGSSAELLCVSGTWTSRQTNGCFDAVIASTQASTASASSDPLRIIIIAASAGFAAIVIIVVIGVTMACRRKREPSNKMNCSMRSHTNNSYYSAHLLPDQPADRARSGIYDTLDENRMQDVIDSPPLPSTSSCAEGAPRCAKTLQANQKLEPWNGASLDRRCGTLPVHRPLPEPHEYTTPLKRDSTYLMPREPVYLNPVPTDESTKGKI